MAGYRQARVLDDKTIALIPLFLVIRALASIGWADARPELDLTSYSLELIDYVERHAEDVVAAYE